MSDDKTINEVVVATAVKVDVLGDRFNRHLIEISQSLKDLSKDFKEYAKEFHTFKHEKDADHLAISERLVKLEVDRGFLAKAIQSVLAIITGGVAGWLAKHS